MILTLSQFAAVGSDPTLPYLPHIRPLSHRLQEHKIEYIYHCIPVLGTKHLKTEEFFFSRLGKG